MTNLQKGIACVIAGAVIGFVASGLTHGSTKLGEVYHSVTEYFPQGINIGPSGTTLSNSISGTCNLSQSTAGSHTATSSKEYFCAVSGVLANDNVIVDLPPGAGNYTSGAGSLFGGFVEVSAYATTTGVIGVLIDNFSGVATSSFAQATTSIEYRIVR